MAFSEIEVNFITKANKSMHTKEKATPQKEPLMMFKTIELFLFLDNVVDSILFSLFFKYMQNKIKNMLFLKIKVGNNYVKS